MFNPPDLNKNHLFSAFAFIAVWLLYGYASGVFDHFHELPMGVHQSAQCDRASLAQNYYYGGFRFLYPEVNENRCIDGIVSCEMPLGAYFAAALYRIFEYDEFYFRLLTYGIFSLGMMALYFLLKTRMSSLLALSLILLLQSSPILLFYCNNFLPDIFSLGLALIAWWLFFRIHIKHPYLPALKQRSLHWLFILCLGFSVATKTTSLLQWLSMAGIAGLSFIPGSGLQLADRRKLISALLVAFCIPLAWYFWSRHLSMTHNSQYFMMSLPQSANMQQYREAWQVYLANWPTQTLSYPLIYIAVALMLVTLFLKRFIQAELWIVALLNAFGAFAFLALMIEQFKYHDYYVICLFPAFALNWLALHDAACKLKPGRRWIKLVLFVLILLALNYQFHTGKKNLEERYTEGNYWEQSHHRARDLDSFRHKVNAIGIDRNACVLAGYDPAPNNLLYLLHLRGHRISKDHDTERLDYILNGAHPRYLISNDSTLTLRVGGMVKSVRLLASQRQLELYELSYNRDSSDQKPE